MVDWRAAAYTAAMPVQIIEHMKAFHNKFVNEEVTNTALLDVTGKIIEKLGTMVDSLSAEPGTVRKLRAAIIDIGAEFQRARNSITIEFPLEATWNDYLTNTAYKVSLWGSQRVCYVAIYNAYENFLARCVATAGNLRRCRTSDRRFRRHFVEAFNEQLLERCWLDAGVEMARLARHALSHAGGRLTCALRGKEHRFVVRDEVIQIAPDDTRALFGLLTERAAELAAAAAALPQFGEEAER
jgi:hypothetical protein